MFILEILQLSKLLQNDITKQKLIGFSTHQKQSCVKAKQMYLQTQEAQDIHIAEWRNYELRPKEISQEVWFLCVGGSLKQMSILFNMQLQMVLFIKVLAPDFYLEDSLRKKREVKFTYWIKINSCSDLIIS